MNEILAALKSGVIAFNELKDVIAAVFPRTTGTSTTATTGASGALPAQPAGYLEVLHPNGTTVKVPFFNT
jgi:hypothetical protein